MIRYEALQSTRHRYWYVDKRMFDGGETIAANLNEAAARRLADRLNAEAKLDRLLRKHRANVFADDEAEADRHYRALRRLRRTKTFRQMCEANAAHSAWLASEALLRRWA